MVTNNTLLDTYCKLCDYPADCIHDGATLCYICVSVVERTKRKQEAGKYVDAEQAKCYSTPSPHKQ